MAEVRVCHWTSGWGYNSIEGCNSGGLDAFGGGRRTRANHPQRHGLHDRDGGENLEWSNQGDEKATDGDNGNARLLCMRRDISFRPEVPASKKPDMLRVWRERTSRCGFPIPLSRIAKKRVRGGCFSCDGSLPLCGAKLPSLRVSINDRPSIALLDTGCSRSIISKSLAREGELIPLRQGVIMMNGEMVETEYSYICKLVVGSRSIEVDCLVSDIVRGFGILLGMDVVAKLGGVTVSGDGELVRFETGSFLGRGFERISSFVKSGF